MRALPRRERDQSNRFHGFGKCSRPVVLARARAYLGAMKILRILMSLPLGRLRPGTPVVPVLRLHGVIGMPSRLRGGLSMASLAEPIERAFSVRGAKAVALALNSPGGSPVQSALIFKRIRALAEEKSLPVYVFAEDVAASGGYWLALAGDEIYADESSVLGSIGVISAGFGFHELIERFGIERRVHTQGARKAMLDPFAPEKPEDVRRLEAIQKDIHGNFKDLVRARRHDRLKASERKLFSGDVWTGKEALALGLIDGLGDLRQVMRDRFGSRVRLPVIGVEKSWIRRRLGLSRVTILPEGWAASVLASIEERAWWSRFGL